MTSSGALSVREFCLQILEGGSLADKLASPLTASGQLPDDSEPGAALVIDRPRRAPELKLTSGAERLPAPDRLRHDPEARHAYLERFAHHELMAVELFAWALLSFPTAPATLRRVLLTTLIDEQRHLQLYLDRLAELGSGLGRGPLSDYLWRHAVAIRGSDAGILAFVSAMGLTFEQANLDFTLLYRDHFRNAGDDASAAVLDRIHRDEIGHVRLALEWLRKLKDPGLEDHEAYARSVPFPLGAARAKGRRFDVAARRKCGFDDGFIAHVRNARPYDDRTRP